VRSQQSFPGFVQIFARCDRLTGKDLLHLESWYFLVQGRKRFVLVQGCFPSVEVKRVFQISGLVSFSLLVYPSKRFKLVDSKTKVHVVVRFEMYRWCKSRCLLLSQVTEYWVSMPRTMGSINICFLCFNSIQFHFPSMIKSMTSVRTSHPTHPFNPPAQPSPPPTTPLNNL
jgi:hypothetical protein